MNQRTQAMVLKKLQAASSAIADAHKMIGDQVDPNAAAVINAKKSVADAITRVSGGADKMTGPELLAAFR